MYERPLHIPKDIENISVKYKYEFFSLVIGSDIDKLVPHKQIAEDKIITLKNIL